jgi:hypothetical protein
MPISNRQWKIGNENIVTGFRLQVTGYKGKPAIARMNSEALKLVTCNYQLKTII